MPRVMSGWCMASCQWNELIQSGCAMASCQWTGLLQLEHGELSVDGLGRVGAWRGGVVSGRAWSSWSMGELSVDGLGLVGAWASCQWTGLV